MSFVWYPCDVSTFPTQSLKSNWFVCFSHFFWHSTECYQNTEVAKCKEKKYQPWHLLCRRWILSIYQTVVCPFWCVGKREIAVFFIRQTNSVIEPCLVLPPMAEILLTFHKRNKISRCYKIQVYCSTFSPDPTDLICQNLIEFKVGQKDIGKMDGTYNLSFIHSHKPLHTDGGRESGV